MNLEDTNILNWYWWDVKVDQIDIDETLKLTQGQGHKVKGQGHICIYVKILFWI